MLLFEKMENALKIFHDRQADRNRAAQGSAGPAEEAGEEPAGMRDELEKGDIPAMLLSAFLGIVPGVLLALVLLVGVAWLLFMH